MLSLLRNCLNECCNLDPCCAYCMLCSYYIPVIDELKAKNFDRSKSERKAKGKKGEITTLHLTTGDGRFHYSFMFIIIQTFLRK